MGSCIPSISPFKSVQFVQSEWTNAKDCVHISCARNLAGYSDHSNLILLQTSATHAVRELLGSAASSANAGIMAGNSKSVILKQSQPLFNMVLLMNTVLIIKHQFLETNTQL